MTHQIIVYAHGNSHIVNQHPDGTWDCPVCGNAHRGVTVLPPLSPAELRAELERDREDAERVRAGLQLDWREQEQERANELLSRHDFESPFEAA